MSSGGVSHYVKIICPTKVSSHSFTPNETHDNIESYDLANQYQYMNKQINLATHFFVIRTVL